MYCGQTPDPGQIPDPENSLSQSGKITGEKNNEFSSLETPHLNIPYYITNRNVELRPVYSEREVWVGGAKNALLGHVNTYRICGPSL